MIYIPSFSCQNCTEKFMDFVIEEHDELDKCDQKNSGSILFWCPTCGAVALIDKNKNIDQIKFLIPEEANFQ